MPQHHAKGPQLHGTTELAKGHKQIVEYFVSEYPLSKLVQTVIQSQSCFSIVVLGPQEKKHLAAMCLVSNKVSCHKQIAFQQFCNQKFFG